jgi:hypothetical protein
VSQSLVPAVLTKSFLAPGARFAELTVASRRCRSVSLLRDGRCESSLVSLQRGAVSACDHACEHLIKGDI